MLQILMTPDPPHPWSSAAQCATPLQNPINPRASRRCANVLSRPCLNLELCSAVRRSVQTPIIPGILRHCAQVHRRAVAVGRHNRGTAEPVAAARHLRGYVPHARPVHRRLRAAFPPRGLRCVCADARVYKYLLNDALIVSICPRGLSLQPHSQHVWFRLTVSNLGCMAHVVALPQSTLAWDLGLFWSIGRCPAESL